MKALAPLLLLAPLATGCTAVKATYHLVEAQQAVSRAENHRAPELAVYEYTMATRFLEKAQEEAGYSDYKTAVELARRSAEWADQSIIAIESEGRDLDLDGYYTMPDEVVPEAGDQDLAEPTEPPKASAEDEALWRELEAEPDPDPDANPEPDPEAPETRPDTPGDESGSEPTPVEEHPPSAEDEGPAPGDPGSDESEGEPSFEVPPPEGNPWEGQ